MRALIFLVCFFVSQSLISQDLLNQRNIQLVYTETTVEATKKIEYYIDSIPEIRNKIKDISLKKYIFLTAKQYKPVLKYVKEFTTESIDKQNEFLAFKNKWFEKYYNIEKIFNL